MNKKRILVVGADSFIAHEFIKGASNIFKITGIARKPIEKCIYIDDFSAIPDKYFKNMLQSFIIHMLKIE